MGTTFEWLVDFFEFFQIPIVIVVGYLLFKKFVPRSSYAEPGEPSIFYKILTIFASDDENGRDDDDESYKDRHYYTDGNGNRQYTTEPKSHTSEYSKSQYGDSSDKHSMYENK